MKFLKGIAVLTVAFSLMETGIVANAEELATVEEIPVEADQAISAAEGISVEEIPVEADRAISAAEGIPVEEILVEEILVEEDKVSYGSAEDSYEMYRMYNPNSGEHFFTKDTNERDDLLRHSWNYEGIGWISPSVSSVPVYRVYDPNRGVHHYTIVSEERNNLVAQGWQDEGIGWYSDDDMTIPVYRQYSASGKGGHNFTPDTNEKNALVSGGWTDEGVCWYGMKDPDPTPLKPVTIYKGVDLAAIYDFGYYVAQNGLDATKDATALEHYVTVGLKNHMAGKQDYDAATLENLYQYFYGQYQQARATLDIIGHDLQTAFNHAAGMKWTKFDTDGNLGTRYYANQGFKNYTGNCYVMAAVFCEMARELGYDAKQISGRTRLSSGGYGPHSWVEIDGYIYDPDFQNETGRSGFHIVYKQKGTWMYITDGIMN